ncbi:RICIN domain-containing protein [Streptomyces sp. AN091965]|uniref:RICIN domain-containing protein n=1 Tax=Streptomyces sp. AN091965 TaxID=2927803 RepID=UPI001F603C60|nr:RICIN domain-containing protein [Streptomyces sp. AN091965]MCI3934526.1 RICIN domain-containing protein [Streptomyces sp. AN091965]
MKLSSSFTVRAGIAASAALAATAVLVGPAHAGVSGQYSFRNAGTGKCLDVQAGSSADNTVLQQFSCNGKAHQRFSLNFEVDNPTSLMRAAHSNKCMQVFSATPGTNVVQRPCDNVSQQRWEFIELGNNNVTVKNVASGLCLDDGAAPSGSRREVRQTVCTGAATQVWTRS